MRNLDYDKDMYHYLRIFGECYKTGNYNPIFKLLADDCTIDTYGVNFKKIQGKDKIIKYYKTKEKPQSVIYEIVKLQGNMGLQAELNKLNKFIKKGDIGQKALDKDGKLNMFLIQAFSEKEIFRYLIDLKINKNGLIEEIFLGLPILYDFQGFLLPRNYDIEELGDSRYPKYDEDNILNDQELCFIGTVASEKCLKKEGYSIIYSNPSISVFPNITAKKDDRLLNFAVRGFNAKEGIPGEVGKKGIFEYDPYLVLDKIFTNRAKEIAKSRGAECHYCLVYLNRDNPGHKYKRGEDFTCTLDWLERGDF